MGKWDTLMGQEIKLKSGLEPHMKSFEFLSESLYGGHKRRLEPYNGGLEIPW